MNFETFFTPRTILKKFTPVEYNYIFENYSEPEIRKLLGLHTDAEFQTEQEKYRLGYSSYRVDMISFQILDKETLEIMGYCGFHHWSKYHSRAELGYSLSNDTYKKKGIMTEVLERIIAYGFNTMHINRMEALVADDNIASKLLLKKYNFTQEGLLRQHYFINGVHEDSLMYSLLRDEYERSVNNR
jgi:[ribosomal protein S5]-alanine N-acetyltransferase